MELGINDDLLLENTGEFNISVSGMAAVPEPSASTLLAGALVFGFAALRRQSARRAAVR
ncbi:MAG TPA: PEP-CTERM sorting domain-containing protein [Chthoniobacterales bacterium]